MVVYTITLITMIITTITSVALVFSLGSLLIQDPEAVADHIKKNIKTN